MNSSGSPLTSAPFIRLLLPLCIGVIIPNPSYFPPLVQTLLIFCLLLLVLFLFRKVSFYKQHFWGILLFLTLFFYGIFRSNQERLTFPLLPNKQYFAVLEDYSTEKAKTFQVVARFVNSEQKILIYLPKSPIVQHAKPGDIISFSGLPELIRNDGNPFEFDYCSYLNNKKIGHRIFLKEDQFNFLNGYNAMNIFHRALIFRAKLVERLDRSGIRSDIVHLIASISFGAREEVDKEVIQSFTNTGVIHILAVSGMNVGLIFIILNFLFRFLKKRRAGLFLHTIIMLCGIWTYTLITGMSASILRAAIMFSFVIIGDILNRNSNIFNSLAVSAFFLIGWDPAIIRDVGFQLSYAAVLSIVVFQPLLYKQLYFKSWLLSQTWLIISVTFAAQIGTIPFTLIYFHQFPVYFWLANLFVIPLVTLILYLSFVVVFLSLISEFLASVVAVVLEWSVRLVLMIVEMVESLPHAVLRNLYPSMLQIFLVFLAVFLFYRYSKSKKIVLLQGVFLLMIFISMSVGIIRYLKQTRTEIVFFNISGTRALALTSNREVIVLFDRCENASEKLGYYLKPYLGERGIRRITMYQFADSLKIVKPEIGVRGNFVFFKGCKLYIQPGFEMGGDAEDSSLGADLVWLANYKGLQSNNLKFEKAKYILYKPTGNTLNESSANNGIESFNMNKSVQLTLPSTRSGEPNRYFCRYFN